MWQAQHVAKNQPGPPWAWERPGETGMAALCPGTPAKPSQAQLGVDIFRMASSDLG